MVKLVSLYSRYGDRWKNTDIERIQKLHDEEPTHVENKGGAYKMLPIHYAIMNGAPLVVIQRLYNLYKDGIKETHADGWLPLQTYFQTITFNERVLAFDCNNEIVLLPPVGDGCADRFDAFLFICCKVFLRPQPAL